MAQVIYTCVYICSILFSALNLLKIRRTFPWSLWHIYSWSKVSIECNCLSTCYIYICLHMSHFIQCLEFAQNSDNISMIIMAYVPLIYRMISCILFRYLHLLLTDHKGFVISYNWCYFFIPLVAVIHQGFFLHMHSKFKSYIHFKCLLVVLYVAINFYFHLQGHVSVCYWILSKIDLDLDRMPSFCQLGEA